MKNETVELIGQIIEKGYQIDGYDAEYRGEGFFWGLGEMLKIGGVKTKFDKKVMKRLEREDVFKSNGVFHVPVYSLKNFVEITGVLQ